MFEGHPGMTKNASVIAAWALAAAATGTGWKVWNDTELSVEAYDQFVDGSPYIPPEAKGPMKAAARDQTHIDYLLAAAILATVGLVLATAIATDYAVDMFNLARFHIYGLGLAWGCLLAATAIWWWIYDTEKVAENPESSGNYNDYLLTAASTSLIATLLLTGAVVLEMNVKVPLVDRMEKSLSPERKRTSKKSPGRKSSPGRELSMKMKKASPKRK